MNLSPETLETARGKSPLLAALLSLVPGLGHLYLGVFSKGLAILTIFFGGFVVMVAAPLVSTMGSMPASKSLVATLVYVLLIAPVSIFYSIFDAYHIAQLANKPAKAHQHPQAHQPHQAPYVPAPTTLGAPAGDPMSDGGAVAAESADAVASERIPVAVVNNQQALTWGVILTGAGLLSLVWSVGGYRMGYVLRLWPLILVALGMLILAGNWQRPKAQGQ